VYEDVQAPVISAAPDRPLARCFRPYQASLVSVNCLALVKSTPQHVSFVWSSISLSRPFRRHFGPYSLFRHFPTVHTTVARDFNTSRMPIYRSINTAMKPRVGASAHLILVYLVGFPYKSMFRTGASLPVFYFST
jgi:hypothetical protein